MKDIAKRVLWLLSLLDFNAVGVRKARNVAGSFNLPIIGVHHMEAHALVARYKINNELIDSIIEY